MPIGRIGNDFIVNTTTENYQSQPAITALADGRFVVTFTSYDGGDGSGGCVRARIYNADGTAAGDDFIVNTTATDDQGDPAITALADGRFVVTFTSVDTGDGSGFCVRARIYDADGTAAGDDFIVNTTATDDQLEPAITALADGRFAVTFRSDEAGDGSFSCVRARIYNADGTAAGNDFIVNSTTTSNQYSPAITALADGRFVVTFGSADPGDGSGTCVRARIYNANGTAVGNDFIVNTTTTNNQFQPAVTALADGRFVVKFSSYDQGDGSGTCVRARIYNADGTAAGDDFIVNTTTTDTQSSPAVTALADGRFVVTFESRDTGDGSGFCVRARLYNADGTAAGNDFIVNTTTTNNQFQPAITALADGRFVVTFRSDDGGDGSAGCVRAEIFDPKVFVGTVADEVWKGGSLDDTINGNLGNDTLSGLAGNDRISGDGGNDTLSGGAGVDALFGGTGRDTLDGGTGADRMYGGADNDIYYVDTVGDQVYETAGDGIDNVYVTTAISYVLRAGAEVEGLRALSTGSTYAVNLTGNEFAQGLSGNAAANVLDGKGGADRLYGYAGNDIYYVDNVGDQVFESAGNGTDNVYVTTAISYALQAGAEVEGLRATSTVSTYAVNLTGNEFAQALTGNAAANVLDGKGGADRMYGYAGNDIYYVDNVGDQVFESAGNGTDNVYVTSAISYALQAGAVVEGLRATSTVSTYAVNLTGNEFAQALTGNAAANVLDGKGGADRLYGYGGSDTFSFSTALGGGNVDTIADFSPADDTIQLENAVFTALPLGLLQAAAFWTGTAAHDADDRIIYNNATGALIYDSNGNAAGGATQFATLSPGLALTRNDFVVT